MKKSFMLAEVLIAASIFAALGLSLCLLLRSGLDVRRRIELSRSSFYQPRFALEYLAGQLRDGIVFDPDNPVFKGTGQSLEFYALVQDYVSDLPRVEKINYTFALGRLSRKATAPLTGDVLSSGELLDGAENVTFVFIDQENCQRQVWDTPKVFPRGIKIQAVFNKGGQVINKYVCLNHN